MKEPITIKNETPIVSPESNTPSDVEQEKTTQQEEVDGRGGLEPTRYGDWEKNGRCIDF